MTVKRFVKSLYFSFDPFSFSPEAKGWRVHAWCLMSNHYHLLIQTPDANLVEEMKWLQSIFAGAKCLASGAASDGDVELGEQSCQPLLP